MKLTINNFRRIESATIELDKIALVCGHNANGKTSITQALAASLTKDASIIAGLLKKQNSNLVKDGEKFGNFTLSDLSAETISMSFPTGAISDSGTSNASRIACGLDRFGHMDKKEAAKIIYGVLKVNPEKEEFKKLIRDAYALISDKELAELWQIVSTAGWDAARDYLAGEARGEKGKWEQVTRQKWGSEKSRAWAPEGFSFDDVVITDEMIAELKKAHEVAIANKAVSIEEKARLVDLAINYDDLRAQYSLNKKHVDATRLRIADIEKTIFEIKDELRSADTYKCPKCSESLVLSNGELVTDSSTITDARKAELNKELTTFIDGLAFEKKELEKMENDLAVTLASGKAAGDAAKALEGLSDDGMTEEQVIAAKNSVDDAIAKKASQKAYDDAMLINENIAKHLKIADELAPDGIRKRLLDAKLAEFNNGLIDKYSSIMQVKKISLDADMNLWLGNRSYLESSSAEQFIMDIVVQFAIASLDASAAVIIDGADIIQYPKGRENLIIAAKYFDRAVLITMSMSQPENCPNLGKAGLGRTYWVEDGKTRELV